MSHSYFPRPSAWLAKPYSQHQKFSVDLNYLPLGKLPTLKPT
jgi:hypothetical protein